MRGDIDWTRGSFTLRPACSQEGLSAGSGEAEPEVQGLQEGKELNQSLVNKHCAPMFRQG